MNPNSRVIKRKIAITKFTVVDNSDGDQHRFDMELPGSRTEKQCRNWVSRMLMDHEQYFIVDHRVEYHSFKMDLARFIELAEREW